MQDLPEQGHSIPHTGKRLHGQESAGHTHLVPPSPAWHDSQRQQLWCSLVILVIIIVLLLVLHILHSGKSGELAVLQAQGQVLIEQDTAQGRVLQTQPLWTHEEALCQLSLGQRPGAGRPSP